MYLIYLFTKNALLHQSSNYLFIYQNKMLYLNFYLIYLPKTKYFIKIKHFIKTNTIYFTYL